MDEMKRELTPDEMEKVLGGSMKTIKSGGAIVRIGAGSNYGQLGRLSGGAQVNFTGTVSYNSEEGQTWYLISSPYQGWIRMYDVAGL